MNSMWFSSPGRALLAFRGVVVGAVTVALADAAVLAVNQDLGLVASGSVASRIDGLLLGAVDRGGPLVALNLHSPPVRVRHDVDVLAHFRGLLMNGFGGS
jgi:hypothetical protein